MRITKLLLLCLCCLLSAPIVWGQAANSSVNHGVLGYLDPHTGAFRPIPRSVPTEDELPAATTVTGTMDVTITVTLKTTGITNVTCSIDLATDDGSPLPTFWDETNTVAGTGSGGTRTCTLSIPYSWSLTTQTSDTMSTSYSVFGSTGTGLPERSAMRNPLDSRKVPSSGTTTKLTASVTL